MYGLIDCNNFFVSCERLFRPDLADKPVVVMSNNDGCAVAMSNEAKAIGIKRGVPIYQIKQLVAKHNVITLSGNHRLYGNISSRVMATIGAIVPDIEIYSIDEAFLDMSPWAQSDLEDAGRHIVARVRRDVGIPTSLGIAPTKTLAKVAARFAKKYPGYRSVCVIDTDEKRRKALNLIDIGDVWGIGRRLSARLRSNGIDTALKLADMPLQKAQTMLNSVSAERIWRELNSVPCIENSSEPLNKQICASRSFKTSLTQYDELREAITHYCDLVSRRLRKQHGCAKSITLFIQTNSFRSELPQHYGTTTVCLDEATDDTLTLSKACAGALKTIFKEGYAYRRAGVIVTEIVPGDAVQQNLFTSAIQRQRRQRLMNIVDVINSNDDTRDLIHCAASTMSSDSSSNRAIQRPPIGGEKAMECSSFLKILYSVTIAIILGTLNIFATTKDNLINPDTLNRIVNLDEVVVKPQKEKYSKKNNPAVDFMQRIRNNADLGDPYQKDNYNFQRYERVTIALNNIADTIGENGGLLKQFQFLNQYVDTSDVTGRPILPISVKERVTDVYNRRTPKATREFITGIHRRGIDEIANQEAMQVVIDDFLREIDLYQNDITLLTNRFVSPLSKIGPDFYKYWLTDTVAIGADSCAVLTFAPRNNATFGFVGRLYVNIHDPGMFIRHATLTLSHNANVNYVKTMRIDQSFIRLNDGTRLKTDERTTLELELIPGMQGIYAQKTCKYINHNFNPADRQDLYERLGTTYCAADAYLKDDSFWSTYREEDVPHSEREIGTMLEQMRTIPAYMWLERSLRLIVTGYIPLGKDDKVELGPVNTLLSFNDVEGTRFRFGGLTTGNLSNHWFGRIYGAYGTNDKKWKYGAEIEYSFNEKKRHSREFPIHSLRLSHKYDVDAIGQDYAFTNPDNIFLSLKRMEDTLMVYKRDTRLDYTLELDNNFSFKASIANTRLEPSEYLPFNYFDGTRASHLTFNSFSVTLRYAPGEKFMQTKSYRIPVNLDAPIFQLTHTIAPANVLGSSQYTINKTEAMFQKRFWFSAFGYTDVIIKGGHVWSTVPYTELLIPNANLSYTIQPESFALLSPMEFILDSYASFDVTYWANGAIFNYIPYFQKLRLREVISFRGIWGNLSDKNNPMLNHWLPQFPANTNLTKINSTPYMEISAGVDNVFRVLRIDYVWRLSYRDTPGVDRSGLRIALHFNF